MLAAVLLPSSCSSLFGSATLSNVGGESDGLDLLTGDGKVLILLGELRALSAGAILCPCF